MKSLNSCGVIAYFFKFIIYDHGFIIYHLIVKSTRLPIFAKMHRRHAAPLLKCVRKKARFFKSATERHIANHDVRFLEQKPRCFVHLYG